MGKKSLVDYKLFGEGEKIIAEGSCVARQNDWEMYDICKHAGVNMDDVWSAETTKEA